MMVARRASAVIPIKLLWLQYSPALYNPKAGGMARFQARVQPPPIRVWHLANYPAVPALRAIVGENLPAHRPLGSVQAGPSGIRPLGHVEFRLVGPVHVDGDGDPVSLVPTRRGIRHHQPATGRVVGIPRGFLHKDRLSRYVLQGDPLGVYLLGPPHAAGPRGEGLRPTKPQRLTGSAGAGPVPIAGRRSRMAIVRLVDGRCRAQRVFAHFHGVAPWGGPDPDFHEPSITQEPVIVRGVALAVCQTPEHAGHVRVDCQRAHICPHRAEAWVRALGWFNCRA